MDIKSYRTPIETSLTLEKSVRKLKNGDKLHNDKLAVCSVLFNYFDFDLRSWPTILYSTPSRTGKA
jgi:hypothetical protein